MKYMMMEPTIRARMEAMSRSGWTASAEERARYEARMSGESGLDGSRILSVAGDTAEISIRGLLSPAPDIFAYYFGGGNTVYGEIISALATAEADRSVRQIVLDIDSGGGYLSDFFETVSALQRTSKPITARVRNMAASAAYGIAAQADRIEAVNRAVEVGSIGIAVSMMVDESIVTLTSTEAPDKRPDVTTEEGRAAVVEELDAFHQLFVEAIAEGRGTTVEAVNKDYGRGAVMLADKAKSIGMIDAIAETSGVINKPLAERGKNTGASNMDLKELKAQHPEAYEAAVQDGVAKERDRVSAHLIMGEKSGDMKTALGACKDGSEMTASLQATYLSAGMNRADIEARQSDDAQASGAEGASDKGSQVDPMEAVAAAVEEKLGMEA